MSNIENFKVFVKSKPALISYVRNNEMTWQQFYDLWYLYGPNHEIWNKYTDNPSNNDADSVGDFINMIRNVDMENVRKNISNIEKAIGMFQQLVKKDNQPSASEPYTPRPLFRRFED